MKSFRLRFAVLAGVAMPLAMLAALKAEAANTITFDNQSGKPALVKLVGPTAATVEVADGAKQTTTAAAGHYTIKVRYGTAGAYTYSKGDEFDVTETASRESAITITLHAVVNGNYGTRIIDEAEFGATEEPPNSQEATTESRVLGPNGSAAGNPDMNVVRRQTEEVGMNARSQTPMELPPGAAEICLRNGARKVFSPPIRFKGMFSSAEITIYDLDEASVSSIRFSNDGDETFAVILMCDGTQIGLKPIKTAQIFGKGDWGDEDLLLSDVNQLRINHAGNSSVLKPDVTGSMTTWRLRTKQGAVLTVLNFLPRMMSSDAGFEQDTKVNNDAWVTDLDWDAIASVSAAKDGADVKLMDGSTMNLSGHLSGQSSYGTVSFDVGSIADLQPSIPTRTTTQSHTDGQKVIGKLRTCRGAEYPVSSLNVTGSGDLKRAESGEDFWGFDLFVLKVSSGELWIPGVTLWNLRIATKEKELAFMDPGFSNFQILTSDRINFKNAAGSYQIETSDFQEFVPDSQSPPVNAPLISRFRVEVHSRSHGTSGCETGGIEFARYPRLGFTGSYPKWQYPFQWQRSEKLMVKRSDDGSMLNVDFENLAAIRIKENYLSRSATLVNRNGSTLEGHIYPGQSKEDGATSGVYEWDSQAEGLLCELVAGCYLFVRFSDVDEVEIEQVK